MKNSYFQFLILFLLLALFGCEHTPTLEDRVQEKQITFTPLMHTPEDNMHVLLSNASNEVERQNILSLYRTYLDMYNEAWIALNTPGNWENADRLIRNTIDENNSFRFIGIYEQRIAHAALSSYLLQHSYPDEEILEAIGYYTDLLLKNNNPDGSVIAPSLQLLKDSWDHSMITTAASQTITNAQMYLEKRNYLFEEVISPIESEKLEDAEMIKLHKMNVSIQDLERLAGSL